jgi:hypothetical protein
MGARIVMSEHNGEGNGNGAHSVGMCAICRVTFFSSPDGEKLVQDLLRVHEMICPGGDRTGERVMPIAAKQADA